MTANRRQFIGQSAALAGGLSCWASLQSAIARTRQDIDPSKLKQFQSSIKGSLVLPEQPEFDSAKRVFYWNPETEQMPVAVLRCGDEEDAVRGVEFAREHDLEVAVRSGGHSHLAWGSSNGLVIDLSPLKQIAIDPERRIVRAQGGVFGAELARAAGQFGLAPVLGQCPDVGATGVTLGGGLGWLSGLHGACCDNLLHARLVTADARTMDVNETTYPDLFWALRGAGANFGVTTSFEARLVPLKSVLGGDIHFATSDARAVLAGFRDLMRDAPDTFQATLNLTRGERGLFLSLCHAGDEKEANQLMQTIRSIAKPTREVIERQEYAVFASRAPATKPAGASSNAMRAIQTIYRDEITDEVIDMLVDQLASASPDVVMGLSHYMHGQVCRVAPDATAFPHRQAHAVYLRAAFNWSDPAATQQRLAWGQQWLSRLRPAENERIYANYQTYQCPAGSRALFDLNYERLLDLKKKYDPTNFFHRNANIA